MAVGFNIPNGAFQLSAEGATGMPDWAKAMSQGFQGAADVYKPRKASEDLLAQMLTNKMNKPKAEHAEEIESLGRQLQRAQINKANRGPATVYSNLEKAMQGYDRIKQQYGEGSPQEQQAKAYVQRTAEGAQGVTVYDPETGQPMVQVGGSSKSGGRTGGGGGVYQTQGGDQFTPVTGTTATKLQNRIIGEEQLEPIIKDIIDKVPQFQSGWKQLVTKAEGKFNRWGGADFRDPSTLKAGHAALSKSAESLVNLFGLHANARNVEEVKNILEPGEDESKEGYKARVIEELDNFAKSKGVSQGQLRRGIQVNASQQPVAPVMQKPTEKKTKVVEWVKVNGKYVPKN